MLYDTSVRIGDREISVAAPTYFIADIAANHDGDLERAKRLIWMAKEAGADCAKFQHFTAGKIISSVGFAKEGSRVSHQANWKKSVSEVYDQYHTRREWNEELVETCRAADIEFMTTPYDFEAVDMFASVVRAFKVGSGDITFHDLIAKIADTRLPVILATGAATMEETSAAVDVVLARSRSICLLQCNTNYTGSLENFSYVNLNVIKSFAVKWPGMILGLSDHTPGHSAVLGAVALGARVIEKHFTDDNSRIGPDHAFALNPVTWRAMVDATRELELAMGDGVKRIEGNEMETVVIQRRALRATRPLPAGHVVQESDVEALRPCPRGAITPAEKGSVIGQTLQAEVQQGEEFRWTNFGR
jgi:sialic acid synthase SpsE